MVLILPRIYNRKITRLGPFYIAHGIKVYPNCTWRSRITVGFSRDGWTGRAITIPYGPAGDLGEVYDDGYGLGFDV